MAIIGVRRSITPHCASLLSGPAADSRAQADSAVGVDHVPGHVAAALLRGEEHEGGRNVRWLGAAPKQSLLGACLHQRLPHGMLRVRCHHITTGHAVHTDALGAHFLVRCQAVRQAQQRAAGSSVVDGVAPARVCIAAAVEDDGAIVVHAWDGVLCHVEPTEHVVLERAAKLLLTQFAQLVAELLLAASIVDEHVQTAVALQHLSRKA